MPKLTIDDVAVQVPEGTSILEAALQAGVKIPSLCYLPEVQAIGACRVCMVQVEGARAMVASCVTPAAEGMKVHTNSRRVRENRRMIVELLLSDHDGDCQTCLRNNDCELQALAQDLGVRTIAYTGEMGHHSLDTSTTGLRRDAAKCILCRRCVTVCNEVQGVGALFPQGRGFDTMIAPAFCNDLVDVVCVQCGQCAAVCPVGAITEKDQVDEVWAALEDPKKTVVVQTAPAIRAALGECFDHEPGTLVTGKMISALRRLGFDAVFDTNFTADLTIIEEGTELLTRLKKALVDREPVSLPMFTSCCPGWISFAEYFYPELLPHLSTCKSPQQMFGALAKTYYANQIGKKAEDIYVVSVMPCVAKKYECSRPEMNASGARDVDVVLTTRELGRMIRQAGINFDALPDGTADVPLGLSSGAADIFANTGGVMEAALRTVYELVTGNPFPFANLHVKAIEGLDGIKEAEVTFEETLPEWSFLKGVTAKVAVVHTLANARIVAEKVKAGEADYHFVEVMTCPGGCISGGGQPRFTTNEVREARMAAIFEEDEGKPMRKSHENPAIKEIYSSYLGTPLGAKSHQLLHTHYHKRETV